MFLHDLDTNLVDKKKHQITLHSTVQLIHFQKCLDLIDEMGHVEQTINFPFSTPNHAHPEVGSLHLS